MLDLDIRDMLFQIVNFLILFAVLAYFIIKPLQRIMKRRTAEATKLLDDAAREKEIASRLRHEIEERLEKLRVEAEEIRAKAREQSETEREMILQQAKAEAQLLREEAQREMQQEYVKAVERFRRDILSAIIALSSQVLSDIVPPEAHDRLVSEISERIYQMGRGEMERVEEFRRSLGEREPVAVVTSPRPLSVEQQRRLVETLSALADRRVTLQMIIDPSLIAGLRVRLGDTIVDNSLHHQLTRLQEQVEKDIIARLQT